MEPVLTEYDDLLANVRYDNRYHSIRDLVQPFDPTVLEIANILRPLPDRITAVHDLIHAYYPYIEEAGDYWSTPAEMFSIQAGDCDCTSILMCSILRNFIPADQVFCAVGMWSKNGHTGGHMWVDVHETGKSRQVLESTAASDRLPYGLYQVSALFNDEYTFATPRGLKEFGLIPTEDVAMIYERAYAIPSRR